MEGQHYLATKCLRIPFSLVVWQVNVRFVRLVSLILLYIFVRTILVLLRYDCIMCIIYLLGLW